MSEEDDPNSRAVVHTEGSAKSSTLRDMSRFEDLLDRFIQVKGWDGKVVEGTCRLDEKGQRGLYNCGKLVFKEDDRIIELVHLGPRQRQGWSICK